MLQVKIFEGKGRGIVAARKFEKGEFVVEYAGDLISMEEAQIREAIYARDENIGCYMYYFKHKNNQHWYVSSLTILLDGLQPSKFDVLRSFDFQLPVLARF